MVNAQPYQGKKKGADNGIDGLIYFQDEPNNTKKIIVSVKGGDNVSVAQVRDLKGVMEREKAAMGLFVALASPTKNMEIETTKAGFYSSPYFTQRPYPRLQILTIEGLLRGTERAQYPDLSMGAMTYRKAVKENQKAKQVELVV